MKNMTVIHFFFIIGILLLCWSLASCSRSKKIATKYPPSSKQTTKTTGQRPVIKPSTLPKSSSTTKTVRPKSSTTTTINKPPKKSTLPSGRVVKSKKETPPKKSTLPPGQVITPKKDIPPPQITMPTVDLQDPAIIKRAQVLLYLHSFPAGKVDGTLKEETMDAIQSFQKQQGLAIGAFNQKTAQALGVPLMDFKVSDLQTALDQKGFDAGPIDNLIGRMTKGAYLAFLEQNHFPTTHLIPVAKQALFSPDPKYRNNTSADALMEGRDIETGLAIPNPALTISIQHASIPDVKQALLAKGYDPGPENSDLTPQLDDALFRYQVDHQLPMGGMNKDTLLSLGFRPN